jgi:toxin HigB-1
LSSGAIVTLAVSNAARYHPAMIRSFRGKDTEQLFRLGHVRRWAGIERAALRKLVQLDLARTLDDMRAPPGNRLEALSGDRKGQWSIRINDQFRVCFRWTPDGPEDVEIVDYH